MQPTAQLTLLAIVARRARPELAARIQAVAETIARIEARTIRI